MAPCRWSPGLAATLVVMLGGVGAAGAEEAGTTTQVSPLATEPLPAEGPGQAAMGNAITGSAPGPGGSSPIDNSQAQEGVLLRPGEGADDMDAASGKPAE